MPSDEPARFRIAVVGPCSAGKTELVRALRAEGYDTRHVAQEHSRVTDLWRRLYPPDVLIYLDVSYQAALRRRPHTAGEPQRLQGQKQRLQHARQHCDFYLDTSNLTIPQVRQRVYAYLATLPGAIVSEPVNDAYD